MEFNFGQPDRNLDQYGMFRPHSPMTTSPLISAEQKDNLMYSTNDQQIEAAPFFPFGYPGVSMNNSTSVIHPQFINQHAVDPRYQFSPFPHPMNQNFIQHPPHSPQTSPIHMVTTPSSSDENISGINIVPPGVQINVQPVDFQVVNYNIHPWPEIEFLKPFSEQVNIQAYLVAEPNCEIPDGFVKGDVQVIKAGATKVTFPQLHLNRMTHIKVGTQTSGAAPNGSYFIRFKVANLVLTSSPFKLVSAKSQIPEERRGDRSVRPRLTNIEKKVTPIANIKRPRTVKSEEFEDSSDLEFIHVKIRGDLDNRGFIGLSKNDTLKNARDEIGKSDLYPANFRFWFEKMSVMVHPHQEEMIKACDALDGTALILEVYDPSMHSIDDKILSLWISKKEVPIDQVTESLFSVYNLQSMLPQELDVTKRGVAEFFTNVSTSKNKTVSMEDLKLFFKFFGPAKDCLYKVYSVYREPYFHGFTIHSEATRMLKGYPGAFLIRYSESQFRNGFFAFNVNKGTNGRDSIENYSLKYDPEYQAFIFRENKYKTLRDFREDPEHAAVLRIPMHKIDNIKQEPRYNADEKFTYVSTRLQNNNMQQ